MDISRLLGRLPTELSGGEQQRVAVAKALLRRPAVFLFDEPLSHLDAKLRVEMRRELKQLHRRTGGTMVYVTHDQVEAMTLGDRIAVLDQGRLQQVGTPAEVYERPANRFVAGFVGTPAMSFCLGQLRRDEAQGGTVTFQSGVWSIPVETYERPELLAYLNRPIVLGLRSGDVHLRSATDVEPGGVETVVALVEPLGDVNILHLEWDCVEPSSGAAADGGPVGNSVNDRQNGSDNGQQSRYLACQASAAAHVAAGDRVRVGIDVRRAYWFDPESGLNLCQGITASTVENPIA